MRPVAHTSPWTGPYVRQLIRKISIRWFGLKLILEATNHKRNNFVMLSLIGADVIIVWYIWSCIYWHPSFYKSHRRGIFLSSRVENSLHRLLLLSYIWDAETLPHQVFAGKRSRSYFIPWPFSFYTEDGTVCWDMIAHINASRPEGLVLSLKINPCLHGAVYHLFRRITRTPWSHSAMEKAFKPSLQVISVKKFDPFKSSHKREHSHFFFLFFSTLR